MRKPLYLRQVNTGRLYIYTEALAKHADMQLVSDSEVKRLLHQGGESVAESAPAEPAPQEEPETQDGADVTDYALVKPISRMSKEELEVYAINTFGVDIDKRKSLTELRQEVQAMAREGAED